MHLQRFVTINSLRGILPLFFVALPLILTGIFGCASIMPTYEGGQRNIFNNDTQYKLAAIEFGELGSYADPYKGELNNTIQLLRNTERPLLVVYIHGCSITRHRAMSATLKDSLAGCPNPNK